MKIDGGCHCGHLTYEAEADPAQVIACHCTDCQIVSGAPFRTVVFVPEDRFLLRGDPKIYVKTADSGAQRALVFCPECGTHIYATSVGDGPRTFGVRVGTARQRAELPPRKQYWCRSELEWLADLGEIERAR